MLDGHGQGEGLRGILRRPVVGSMLGSVPGLVYMQGTSGGWMLVQRDPEAFPECRELVMSIRCIILSNSSSVSISARRLNDSACLSLRSGMSLSGRRSS